MSRAGSVSSFGGPAASWSGSAPSPFLDRVQAKQRLERTQQQWSRTNNELNELVRVRSLTPHMSPVEVDHKDKQINSLQIQLASMEQQMRQCVDQLKVAEATIKQQQATIRNQSKAIENPWPNREIPGTPGFPANVHAQHGIGQYASDTLSAPNRSTLSLQDGPVPLRSIYGPLPPAKSTSAFSSPNKSTDHTFETNFAKFPQQPGNIGRATTDFGSPKAWGTDYPSGQTQDDIYRYNQQVNPQGPCGPFPPASGPAPFGSSVVPPQSRQAPQSPKSNASSNPYPETSIPSAQPSQEANKAKVVKSFQQVFDMAVQYAKLHANVPSTAGDNALSRATKEKLMKAATATSAFNLMSTGSTRYLLVAKVMLLWVIKHVFKYNTFSGLDTSIDQVIEGTRATIYQSTPAALRYLLLSNIANETKKILDKPSFPAFSEHLGKERANQLWILVRPMMHCPTTGDWEDLVTFMKEVHNLAGLMFASVNEYRFDFPEHGHRFDRYSMHNIDPELHDYTLDELRSLHATIKLGVTPIVNARWNVPQGMAESKVALRGLVLLKLPRA